MMTCLNTTPKPPKGGTTNILLSELIDYAGLFPPAQLTMEKAVENYARYIESEHKWMLARFVLPLSRLSEFEKEADKFLSNNEPMLWRLSALCGANLDQEIEKIDEFNRRYSQRAIIDAIEIKASSATEIEEARAFIPSSLMTFCEIPITEISLIAAIANAGFRAKARTGGVRQDMFPLPEDIARFIFVCRESNAAFKATAGLHHPLRCIKPLTYETDATRGTMHGFLNVFLAAALIRCKSLDQSEAIELLLDENVSSFAFENDAIAWRGFRISAAELKDARDNFSLSFGSCSFEEPIEDLKELGVL
jgi:hypothetical protein